MASPVPPKFGTSLRRRKTGVSAMLAVSMALSATMPGAAAAETPLPAPTRVQILSTIDDLRNLATPESIRQLEQVKMSDGDAQWISIRGRNRANPVIVVVHGGPGAPMMPFAWTYQSAWEDYFTVVNWDQRGTGKNAATFDRGKMASTMTMGRVIRDGIEVVEHVRKALGKDKVVLLGFSWGSMVGTHIVKERPELFSAYVGVGQAASPADEAILYSETIKAAERHGDSAAVTDLKSMAPYPRADGTTPMEIGFKVRNYARQYDGLWYGQGDTRLIRDVPFYASEYSDADLRSYAQGASWLAETGLIKALETDDLRALGPEYKIPMIVMMGRYDLFTPYASAKKWHSELKAPAAKFITFDRSSHFIMIEEPGRFLVTLVNDVLPFTEGVAAYPDVPRAKRVVRPVQ